MERAITSQALEDPKGMDKGRTPTPAQLQNPRAVPPSLAGSQPL